MDNIPSSIITAIHSGDFSPISTTALIKTIGLYDTSETGRWAWGVVMAELDRRFDEARRRLDAERVGG